MGFEMWLLIIFALLFGVIIGSFLNVVILRLPKEETLGGRSHCVNCGKGLSPWELIPVISYLLLRGKCSNCGKRISPRYILIELTTGVLFAGLAAFYSPFDVFSWVMLVRGWFILCVLLVVFVIDLEHYLILDKIIFPAAGTALVLNIVLDLLAHNSIFSLSSYFFGGLVASVSLTILMFAIWYLSKGKWLGFGDVKFMIFFGFVLGFPLSVVGYFITFLLGALVSIPLLVVGTKTLKSRLPLGVFLATALLITMLYGEPIFNWYLGFIGL